MKCAFIGGSRLLVAAVVFGVGSIAAAQSPPPAQPPAGQAPAWSPPEGANQPGPNTPVVPPPGTPPAPGYPPPGYAPPGYPPPGYAQPGYPPPGVTGQQPPVKAARSGFLVLPFLGVHSYQGDGGEGTSVGLRLGTLLGGRVHPMFSINGGIGIDVINLKNVPAGVETTGVSLDLTLSPLVHVPVGNLEFVLGPKLGGWAIQQEAKQDGATAKQSISGAVLGVNVGMFANVSDKMAVGGLLNFDLRTLGEGCQTLPGEAEMCGEVTGDSNKVVTATAALLF